MGLQWQKLSLFGSILMQLIFCLTLNIPLPSLLVCTVHASIMYTSCVGTPNDIGDFTHLCGVTGSDTHGCLAVQRGNLTFQDFDSGLSFICELHKHLSSYLGGSRKYVRADIANQGGIPC